MIWAQGYGNMAVELREQFGWSKSFLSYVYAGTRAEVALFGPAQGRAIDRLGIKAVMRAGAVLGLVGFAAVAWADTRAEFVAAMAVLGIAMSLIGFLTISSATVRWFERRRARALSILTMGFAFGGFFAPVLVWGFDRHGWRPTILIAGSVLSAAAWWAAAIVSRTPADHGEPMDGLDDARQDAERRAEVSKQRNIIDETENIQMYSEKRNLTCDKKTFIDNLCQKYTTSLMCDFETKISQKCKILQ